MKNILLSMFTSLIVALLAPMSFSQEKEQIRKLVSRADLIVQAEVVKTKFQPGHWTGYVPAYQEMVYKVEKVIKGALKKKRIVVDQEVVFNSRTADKNVPQLSEEIFQPGRKFILFLRVKNNELVVQLEGEIIEDPTDRPFRYVVFDEDIGALSYSEEKEKLVKKYLRLRNVK